MSTFKTYYFWGSLQHSFIFNLVVKDKIQYPFNGGTINNVKPYFVDKNLELIKYIKEAYKDVYDFDILDIDKLGFYLVEKCHEQEFIKSSNLQIHHKCYRESLGFWEQPDEDYITLCNMCHRIVHEQQMIPYYSQDGNVERYMRPCWKCGGTRQFDCYEDIHKGICYECEGVGFKVDSKYWQQFIWENTKY